MRSFAYVVPDSVAGAVDALAAAEPGTKVLAGGTTLYDLMKLGIEVPPAVIDIHRLAELTGISTGEDALSFGAGVKMAEVADHPVVRRDYPALSESLFAP
ncbi:FAD binding domain-containing protein [Streptomyces mirabilis]|uniref:FAD binding domain-containing protein n=1 Tax=Streptomyces mirabilis TaxID=68239 RepID=UPI0033F65108